MREPAASQIIAGKYRLESLIGHGGMGAVWRARHATLGMPVAIKFMAPQALADAESRQRFDREARALAALRTPHIVQVLDHGVDDDTPYIVMEHLEGEDMSERLAARKRLSLDETSHILAGVARALRRAHEAGITHRDLKPSNIFLARIDDEEVVKVLDFGVAKLAQTGAIDDQGLTRAGTLLGSPGYMSPEQARGKEVDFRSDLWALAVIVFRAVTGAKPFAGDSIAELVIKLCIDPRPVPSRVAPDVPPAVDRFFEKAFAATPEERFHSAVEMAAAFAAMIGRPAGLEVSRSGPSPVAGLSRSWLDGPPPAPGSLGIQAPISASPPPVPAPSVTPPSGQLPAPRPPPSRGQASPSAPLPAVVLPAPIVAPPAVTVPSPPGSAAAAPEPPVAGRPVPAPLFPRPSGRAPQDGTAVMAFPLPAPPPPGPAVTQPGADTPAPKPSQPGLPFPLPPVPAPGLPPGARTTIVIPSPAAREPTPTPASFAGFAPSGAEASAPPAPDPTATPLPDGALRAPPTGMTPAHATGAHPAVPHDVQAPAEMPVHSPTLLRISPRQPAPARPPIDIKVLVFAAAGAAVLAIFFSLAIAGLRRRHTTALRPMDEDVAEPAPSAEPAETSTASAEPAETSTASADPATDPTGAPSAEASADTPADTPPDEPAADPSSSASAEPAAPPPKPTYVAPRPTIVPPRPKPKPKPTATTKSAPAPTSTRKKR